MSRVLIVAYGNPLRCDDGLAWSAAEMLAPGLPGDVEIITRHQLTPELAFPVSQAASVLFIDAAHSGAPGELLSATVKAQDRSSAFTHDFSPSRILSLAQELYDGHPKAFILSLVGKCFDHGETFSSTVEENLPRLLAFARSWIDQARTQPSNRSTA
jgi:hydrogenase maturation protease